MTTTWPPISANPAPPQGGQPGKQPEHRRAATPATFMIIPLVDRFGETFGHRPGDPYVLGCWLPVLGPSATLCWDRLARLASVRPATAVDTVDLAVSLGLGENLDRNGQISRTLHRMAMFGAARRTGDTLLVRRCLPDLADRHLHRLSYTARLAHERWAHSTTTPTPAAPSPTASVGVEL